MDSAGHGWRGLQKPQRRKGEKEKRYAHPRKSVDNPKKGRKAKKAKATTTLQNRAKQDKHRSNPPAGASALSGFTVPATRKARASAQ
jgi:hypothetical protein